jgi:hypothetical protein
LFVCSVVFLLVFLFLSALMQSQSDAALMSAHTELAELSAMKFRFKGVEAPRAYVSHLARQLLLVRATDALSGGRLMTACQPELVPQKTQTFT